MGLDKEKLARESRVVHRALVRAKEKNRYRLSDFLKTMMLELAVIDESVTKNPDHPFRQYTAKIELFTSASSKSKYGHIFDPEVTREYDYETARHFYFVKSDGSQAFPEVNKAFFSLASAVASVLETRFSPKSPHAAETLVIFDEIHFYRKYVTQKSLSDVNRQGRKLAKFLCYASQSLSDGVIDDETEDKKYSFLETVKRFYFVDLGGNKKLWMRALKLSDETDPVLVEMERVAGANIEARSRGEYSWGYVDENKRVYRFFLDMSKFALWCCTTHPGGTVLRKEALRTGLGYFEVCEKLAEKIWPIPQGGNLSQEFLKAQMWNVFDIKPLPEGVHGS